MSNLYDLLLSLLSVGDSKTFERRDETGLSIRGGTRAPLGSVGLSGELRCVQSVQLSKPFVVFFPAGADVCPAVCGINGERDTPEGKRET